MRMSSSRSPAGRVDFTIKDAAKRRDTIAKEVIAVMAEHGSRNGLVMRVVAAVRKFLRKLNPSRAWSDAEIRDLLHQADRFLRDGRTNAQARAYTQAHAFSRADKPIGIGRAIIASTLGRGTANPDYAAAKAGDREAGLRIAKVLVTDGLVQKVRAMLGGRKPVIVPVVSVEATGRNKIPRSAAEVLARKLGLDTTDGITQANAPKRTALDGLDRIFAAPEFDGPVVAGQDYLLLDDTLTQGGTFAALASHIEANGGRVVGAVALTGKQYSATLAPTFDTLRALREKHGDLESDFRAATGYGFDALTESEARYLANFKPSERVRTRILEERGRRRQALGESTTGEVSQVANPQDPAAGGVSDSGPRFSRAPAEELASIEDDMRAVAAAAEGGDGAAARIRQWLKDAKPKELKDRLRGTWLGALTTRMLTTLGTDYFPTMRLYTDFLAEMQASRNEMQQEGEASSEPGKRRCRFHGGHSAGPRRPRARRALANLWQNRPKDA